MAALPHDYEDFLYAKDSFYVFSDFTEDQADTVFVDTVTDTGTVTIGDAVGGIAAMTPSDGTVADNDEVYYATPNEVFLVADNKPLRFACSMQYTEGSTDDANVFCGFMSAIAANALVDDGAGMRTTGNYFVFFKVDGGTTWQVRSRNSTATFTNDTGVTAGGSTYKKFRIEIDNEGDGSVNVVARYFIDDVICKDATTLLPVNHRIPVASSTEMQMGFGLKNGAITTVETLNVDWVYGSQKRA